MFFNGGRCFPQMGPQASRQSEGPVSRLFLRELSRQLRGELNTNLNLPFLELGAPVRAQSVHPSRASRQVFLVPISANVKFEDVGIGELISNQLQFPGPVQ
ncbi:unnamed protein product [Nesidiocoris tenuis]|uniref:Uncharacterized protein n=1 Tax=Nesidiocoris tenuis TaxID=355587 RepID=A0A6H5GYY2_9HEMI|nr:unnamed protein product [Nesidiocoris tenuis]